MNNEMEVFKVSEYARIKFQKSTTYGYKYSDELSEKILQRNYILGQTVQKGSIIEIRQYDNMLIKADNNTKTIIGLEVIKTDKAVKVNDINLKNKVDKLLEITKLKYEEGIRESDITKDLFDINRNSIATLQKMIGVYNISYIKCRQMISKEIRKGKEIAFINGIKYFNCGKFVAIVHMKRNLVQYISYNSEGKVVA